MDELKQNFLDALREAIHRAGSQTELAKSAGMQQSRISDYLSTRYEFDNITVGTLRKIFPELQLIYFIAKGPNQTDVEEELEKQVLSHFRRLDASEKAKYMMLVAANFPEKIREETKK